MLMWNIVELAKLIWQHVMKSIESRRFRFYSIHRLSIEITGYHNPYLIIKKILIL